MTSNYSTIDLEKENNRVKNVNVTFDMPVLYTTHLPPITLKRTHSDAK